MTIVLFFLGLLPIAAIVGAEGKGIERIPGISEDTWKRVEDLAQRIEDQRRKAGADDILPVRIDPREELKKFCSTSDLVALTKAGENWLSQAAFSSLMEGPSLTESNAGVLLSFFRLLPNGKDDWKGRWAGEVLAKDRLAGIPALTRTFQDTADPHVRVHCACALSRAEAVDPVLKRKAQEALLDSLGDPVEATAGTSSEGLSNQMAQWMADRIIERLRSSPPANLRKYGLALLVNAHEIARGEGFRSVCLSLLKDPQEEVRMHAVIGLHRMGMRESDLGIFQEVLRDPSPFVRRRLFYGLSPVNLGWEKNPEKKPWAIPILLAGLDDADLDNAGICAEALAFLGHQPALPKLIEILRKAPGKGKPFDHHREIAQAAVKLAGLEGYDFRTIEECRETEKGRMRVILDRDDRYRNECDRLLGWWDSEGRKRFEK